MYYNLISKFAKKKQIVTNCTCTNYISIYFLKKNPDTLGGDVGVM